MGGKVGWRSPEGWWMFLEKHVVVWAMPPCLKMPLRMYGSAADAMTAQWVSCIDYTTFCEYISSLFHRDTELLGLLHPLYRYVEMQRLHAWKTGIKSTLKTFPGAWSGPLGKGHWQHGTHYPGTEFVFVNDCLGVVPKVVNEALLPGNFGSLTGRKKTLSIIHFLNQLWGEVNMLGKKQDLNPVFFHGVIFFGQNCAFVVGWFDSTPSAPHLNAWKNIAAVGVKVGFQHRHLKVMFS